jgi:YaiO family outer membrane protein
MSPCFLSVVARRLALAFVLGIALASPAVGQEQGRQEPPTTPADFPPVPPKEPAPGVPEPPLSGFVEAGLNYNILTDGQKDWFGQYVRGVVDYKHRDIFAYEIFHLEKFGDQGTFFALGNTHVFTPEWYTSISVGTSAGGFFWPQFRVDAFLSKKWLERQQLITTIGFGYHDAKDVHYDYDLFIGATYYFDGPWIVEAGLHYNISEPGDVTAPGPFIAVTNGRNKEYFLVLRFGFGREAYQVVGPTTSITDFASQVVTLTWRKWLTRDWGFKVQGEYYHNPFYERFGFELGIFRDF